MDRTAFLQLCQRASYKADTVGAWWLMNWEPQELVSWKGVAYVPVDYRFGFHKGQARHLAILHDLRSNTELTVRLEEIQTLQQEG